MQRDVQEPPEGVDSMAELEPQDPRVHRGRMDRREGPERRVRKLCSSALSELCISKS